MNKERDLRRQQRFQTKRNALALVFADACPFFHSIIDISRGGMTFQCLGADAVKTQAKTLAILYEDCVCLDSVPFKLISDILVINEHISTRRCGVKFEDLTPQHQAQLNNYIKKYSVEK